MPKQVTTAGGAAVITIERTGAANASAPSQRPNGEVWMVEKGLKSGLVSSFNKFWQVRRRRAGWDGCVGGVIVTVVGRGVCRGHCSMQASPVVPPIAPRPALLHPLPSCTNLHHPQLHRRLPGGPGTAAR